MEDQIEVTQVGTGRRNVDRHTVVEIGLAVGVLAALLLARNSGPNQRHVTVAAPSTSSIYAQVPADHWLDTGVSVPAGATITFSASGAWTPYKRNTPDCDAEGVPGSKSEDIMCREALWGALVARIGNGPYFKVGKQTTTKSSEGGKLILGMNDDFHSQATGDNTGTMQVGILIHGQLAAPAPPCAVSFPKQ